jgi:ribose 5-phosphate isomerase A
MENEELKKAAGIAAVKYVEDGMSLGLGTGSTVRYSILEIARRIREEGLKVRGIPTSKATEKLAVELGIPLTDFKEVEKLDLTIDGADEVDPRLTLIKGGGGALLREKIVAANSRKMIAVVDESKLVEELGTTFPLPVEIVPFGCAVLLRLFKTFNCDYVELRMNDDGTPYLTDNGNCILMCKFEIITAPDLTERFIDQIPGVVECGLFVNLCHRVIVAGLDGIREITV